MELAANVCDAIKETVMQALTETAFQKVIPLIAAITDAVKEGVQEGEIGPSSVAVLRNWYDSYIEEWGGEFFLHIGLPRDCSWEAFRRLSLLFIPSGLEIEGLRRSWVYAYA